MPPPPVTILEEARVAVPATAALPPEPFVLSALDAEWIALPLIQRLLIFVDGDDRAIPPFASVVAALRASLAETAARFPPLAGRIVYLPATGDAAIDCSDGGVRFLVVDYDGAGVDAARLAGDEEHDAEAFARLVPRLAAGQLPAEAMAAQVTRLRGGVALGVAMHHAVVDGRSVWRFLQAWAAACRGKADKDAPPKFDRAAIRFPVAGDGCGSQEELARTVLRRYTPNLPATAAMDGFLVRANLSRRTFALSAQQVHRLKHRAAARSSPPPSSFVAVVALAWVSFVRARHAAGAIAPDDEVTLFFFADCRVRLDPPPGAGFFGTCISGNLARAAARDLLDLADGDDESVAHAAAAVAAEVRRAAEEPLALWDWMGLVERVDLDRLVNVSGSTRFPAYRAADFGWGPPARTELVTMGQDGQVVLVGGKDEGGMQVSVSLHSAQMEAFKSCFFSYVG